MCWLVCPCYFGGLNTLSGSFLFWLFMFYEYVVSVFSPYILEVLQYVLCTRIPFIFLYVAQLYFQHPILVLSVDTTTLGTVNSLMTAVFNLGLETGRWYKYR